MITVYGSGVPLHPTQPLISGVSCVLGILIVSKKLTLNFGADLKFILLGGICGSILNGLFNSLAINQSFFTLEALYFIFGDVFGQIVLMLLFSQTVKFITSVK